MYYYETHLHTFPVSKCAKATVRENLEYYQSIGYTGVFVTNHFLDGNINIDSSLPYEDRLRFYLSDYEEAVRIGREIGLSVFCGYELSYKGTDFLVYTPDAQCFFEHPEWMEIKKSKMLPALMEQGALVIQAHPYREASYIDHIRLFPRCVQGVEVLNGCRTELENRMAKDYAVAYEKFSFAGSDNHKGAGMEELCGMAFETPIRDECDFIARVLAGEGKIFRRNADGFSLV